MTTLYEFGDNTNDSIQGNFNVGTVFSTSSGGYWVDTTYSNGMGLNASLGIIGATGIAKHQYWKILPNMALYSDLEFQIEYTIFPSTQDLLLFTSQNTGIELKKRMLEAVAVNDIAVVITSSSGPIPHAPNATDKPDVAEFTLIE